MLVAEFLLSLWTCGSGKLGGRCYGAWRPSNSQVSVIPDKGISASSGTMSQTIGLSKIYLFGCGFSLQPIFWTVG